MPLHCIVIHLRLVIKMERRTSTINSSICSLKSSIVTSNIKSKSENLFKELGNKGLKVSIARCFSFVLKKNDISRINYFAGFFLFAT